MPMRSPHAAHSRNGSVITHPSSHLGASRESPPLYAGPDAANNGKSTQFLWTTTEAICQRARENAPTRASLSDRPARTTPAFTSYPASRRPHPPTRSRRAPAEASVPTAPRHGVLTRPSTADRRRPSVEGATADDPPKTPWTRRPRWRRRRTRRLSARAPVAARAGRTPQAATSPLFKPGTRRTDRDQRLKIIVMMNSPANCGFLYPPYVDVGLDGVTDSR